MCVLSHLSGPVHLMATLMYGSGLRLIETCRLRVHDIDFDRQIITVRARKGDYGALLGKCVFGRRGTLPPLPGKP